MNRRPSRDGAYFDTLYRADPDPWNFAASAYEAEKYAATLDALDGRRFARGLEVGCSIGVLTRALAGRCDALLAIDISAVPLRQARARCRDLTHVMFRRRTVPAQWPTGWFDLVVLSELLYFLAPQDVVELAGRVRASLAPRGMVVLVNWLGPTDAPCTGEEAAELFIAACAPPLTRTRRHRAADYRLDRCEFLSDQHPVRGTIGVPPDLSVR